MLAAHNKSARGLQWRTKSRLPCSNCQSVHTRSWLVGLPAEFHCISELTRAIVAKSRQQGSRSMCTQRCARYRRNLPYHRYLSKGPGHAPGSRCAALSLHLCAPLTVFSEGSKWRHNAMAATKPKPLVKSPSKSGMVHATCRVNDSTNETRRRKPPRSQRRIIGAQALTACG